MPQLKRNWVFGILGLSALMLAACASPAERPDAQARITTDEFDPTIDIQGLLMVENPLFGIKEFYNLVTRVDKKTHAYNHVIETKVSYMADPINFQFAADDTAQELKLIRVARTSSRSCDDCYRDELFNIVVPDESLRAHAATGYRVKISSRLNQAIVLTITPQMISAQYTALNRVITPQATTSATPQPGANGASALPASSPPQKRALGISYFKVIFTGDVIVSDVKPGSPAAAAGLQPQDVLVSYNGRPITTEDDVREAVDSTQPGTVVTIEIKRKRQPLTVSAQM